MKVIVDIKNKTLKMLENERSIFKGEYSADKLELYINKQLENEYPVITGLLSNGRRIGAFTTDDGYEMETIDGVEYTKAKFTLSKENGFPLSAGVTQITIWMYRTKDSVLVSKEAIGNVVFTVVDTTAFNDGDIIISGDVEGTVVNLKVEMENLQAKAEQYLPLTGGKPMTGNLKMKGHNIIFDNGNEETIEIGEENNEYSMSIRMEDSDYYKGRYCASGFSIGNESINATLDISESKFEMTLKGEGSSSITFDGFSASKEGTNTIYEDGKVTRYLDNYSKYVEIELPNESGTFETKENVSDLFAKNLTKENLSEIIKDATQSLSGLMSSQDKRHLDTLVNLLEEDNDNVVNTINEILAIFNQYPEGAEILSVLNEKLNKSELLPIIEENAEKTSTLDIGTSETFDATSDEQIPTSKAVSDKFQPKLTAGEGISIENNVISASSEFVTLKQTNGNVTVTYLDEDGTEYNELGSFYVDRVRLKFVNSEVIDIDKPIRINLISTSVDTDLDGRSAVLLHWTNEGYIRTVFLDKYNYDIGIDPVSEYLLINNDMEEDCYIEFEVSLLLYDTSDIRKLSFEIVGHKQNQFTNPSSFFEL